MPSAPFSYILSLHTLPPLKSPLCCVEVKESHRAVGAAGLKLSLHAQGALADTQTPPLPALLLLQKSSTKCRSRSRGAAKATRCHLQVRTLQAQPQHRQRGARAAWPSEHPRKSPANPTTPRHTSGHQHKLVSPCPQCHPCPGAVGSSSLDRRQIVP